MEACKNFFSPPLSLCGGAPCDFFFLGSLSSDLQRPCAFYPCVKKTW